MTSGYRRGSYAQVRAASPNRLADSEEVSFTVAKPRGALAACPGGRIVPVDGCDAVHRPKPRCVVLLERHTAGAQLTHRWFEVVDFERDLRVLPRGSP
jgi:hypothetical protein